MKVNAIQRNEKHNNTFVLIGQGAAIGAVSGYVAKYALPLTYEEKHSDEYLKVVGRIQDQKNAYNIRTATAVDAIKNKELRSLAEDEYVKLFDGINIGEKVKPNRIRKAIKTLEAKDPKEVLNFKKLCKDASEVAQKSTQQCVKAYNLITKHLRPSVFFIATGALVGVFATLINKLLKTDVEQH
jgi:hypothetical protein